ncbi:MAG: hypothetical protein LBJ91_05055 [Clostridiales Family XIII bacterium]|jgi:hypothetical protein|nr:hypothetical protein [Clostridiales Family XIII bacterium]
MTLFTPPSAAWSDLFYERIAGGYALMAMNFTPENMLLLMYAPATAPIYGGGMTNLTNIEHTEYARNYLLNIVNNVVNRVLFMDESRATWRDEVYVSNVLRKLGVTDVDFFMREARSVMNDGRQTWRLLKLYRENEGLLREAMERERVRDAAPATATKEKDGARAAEGRSAMPAALHSEIIRRLRTSEILSSMKAYATRTQDARVSNSFDLSAAEFAFMLNAENLFEHRSRVLGGDVTLVHRHTNAYETADAPPAPAREDDAVGRAVCAAIINIAEHAALTRLSMARTEVNVRVDLSRALPDAARITLERLKSHYAERGYATSTERLFESRLAELDAYESSVIRQLVSETERFMPAERLLLAEAEKGRVDARGTKAGSKEYTKAVRAFHEAQSEIQRERERIERIVRQSAAPGGGEMLRIFTERAQGAPARERPYGDVPDMIESVTGFIPGGADLSPEEMIHPREATALREEEGTAGEAVSGGGAAAAGGLARGLKEEMDAYDRRNKEAARALEERIRSLRANAATPGEDERRRSAREALEALDEPEKLMNALLEGRPDAARGGAGARPPALMLLLEAASPGERALYERVINYVQGAGALAGGAVRPVSPPAFNAEITEIRERDAAEMRHIEREYAERGEFVRERLERVAERERTAPPRGERAYAGHPRRGAPMVHRQQEQTGLSDEDRARIAAEIGGHTRSEVTTRETILREQMNETEINRAVREAEAKKADDIGEMINRALAVQMNTIAGRVYHQVERRLTMERARRGK